MEHAHIYGASYLVFFAVWNNFSLAVVLESWKLIENHQLGTTLCPEDQRYVQKTTDSLIKCLALCSQEPDGVCNVASFDDSTSECFGCGTIEVQGASFIRDDSALYDYLVTGPKGVQDNQMSSSSFHDSTVIDHRVWRARLNSTLTSDGNGCWVPLWNPIDLESFVQVDFEGPRYIKGIVTKGRGGDHHLQYVTSYWVSTSLTCTSFTVVEDSPSENMVFQGNSDNDTPVTNMLDKPVFARCVRIHPVTYVNLICLRFDILGI